MDFDLTIGSTFEHVPTEVRSMISLRKPFQMYSSMFVHDTSYLNLRLRSFPRSSVIAQEYNALNKNWTSLSLHFVTRDMRFIGFNLQGYTDGGSMQRVYEYQLNESLSNADCRELYFDRRFLPLREAFILFCRHYRLIEGGNQETMITIVHVNKTQINNNATETQIVRQYSFPEYRMNFRIDFGRGFVPLPERERATTEDRDLKFFIASQIDRQDGHCYPVVMAIYLAPFDWMAEQNLNYKEGPPMISSYQTFALRTGLYNINVRDSLVIYSDLKLTYLAFALDTNGIFVCPYPTKDLGNIEVRRLVCESSQLLQVKRLRIQALHRVAQADDTEPYFYGVSSRPPAVVEFDIMDVDNIFVNKIYTVSDDRYIGELRVAVNRNYVLHLLEDPDNGRQVVRVFCRFSNLFTSAKFDIPLNPDTTVDFFQFPNRLFNIVVFRDERTVNVTAVVDFSLVLNASDTALIAAYKDRRFEVRLNTRNDKYMLIQNFNVTFLDKHNTSIATVGNGSNSMDMDVFYNCGDLSLDYVVSDLLNGPNYQLTQVGNSSGYFTFMNQEMDNYLSVRFNFSHHCKVNYLFPDLDHPETTILICIDIERSQVASYSLRADGRKNVVKTNEVTLPELRFVDFAYDLDERAIIALAEQPAFNGGTSFVRGRYEIHLFFVQKEIIWRRLISFSKATNVTQMTYNNILKKCIFIEHRVGNPNIRYPNVEQIRVFPFNFSEATIEPGVTGVFRNVSIDQRVVKAQLSSEHALFGLTADLRISVYQITNKIVKVREYVLPGMINFDIFDNEYLVVYSGANLVEVYTIEMFLYLRFKMRLPLYQAYEGFSFHLYRDFNQYFHSPARTYRGHVLTFLMHESSNTSHVLLFTHYLSMSQHNSFVMAVDLSAQYGKSEYTRLVLASDEVNGRITVGTLSDELIALYKAQYCNRLRIDLSMREKLLDRCRDIQLRFGEGGVPDDALEIIDTITVWPISMFKDEGSAKPDKSQSITLKVKSQNQGIAVTTKPEGNGVVNILVFNETISTSQSYALLHETFLEGQALNVSSNCQFIDENNQNKSCKDGTFDASLDVPYSFPIEFVTSQRRVIRSLTLGGLFFMFDNQYQLVVSRLPSYQKNLDSVNGQAITKLFQAPQMTYLECEVTGFVDAYLLANYTRHYFVPNASPQTLTYALFYHCTENPSVQRLVLKIALVHIFEDSDSLQPFNLTVLKTDKSMEVPYNIIDLKGFGLEYYFNRDEELNVQFYITFSGRADLSYSNVLYFAKIMILPSMGNRFASMMDSFCAIDVLKNTYKVTKLLQIPGSELIVTVLEDFGAQILNITKYWRRGIEDFTFQDLIVGELDFLGDQSSFGQQQLTDNGPLRVLAATMNLPNSLFFISNYGLYIYDFPVDLTSEAEIHAKGPSSFQQFAIRQLRMPFDGFNGEVAGNDYGSAFLIRRDHQVQLAALSYYSAPNSRIFKVLNVTKDEECTSLNHDSYYEFSPEDQIAVSFICNQYLMIIRVCMRPNLLLDMSRYAEEASKFEVTLEATNSHYKGEFNKQIVRVEFQYKEKGKSTTVAYVAVGLVVTALILYLVFYVEQTVCQPKAEEEAERQMSVALEAQQRQSTRPKSNGWAVNRTMTESGISSSVRNTQDYFGASLLATERMLTQGSIVGTALKELAKDLKVADAQSPPAHKEINNTNEGESDRTFDGWEHKS